MSVAAIAGSKIQAIGSSCIYARHIACNNFGGEQDHSGWVEQRRNRNLKVGFVVKLRVSDGIGNCIGDNSSKNILRGKGLACCSACICADGRPISNAEGGCFVLRGIVVQAGVEGGHRKHIGRLGYKKIADFRLSSRQCTCNYKVAGGR